MRKLKSAEVASLLCAAVGVFHIGAGHAQVSETTLPTVVITGYSPVPPGGLSVVEPSLPQPSGYNPNLSQNQQDLINTINCILNDLFNEQKLGANSTKSDPSLPYNQSNSDTFTSTRFANPTNLSCVKNSSGVWVLQSIEKTYGATGCGGGGAVEIAIFPNMADGINAAMHSLDVYGNISGETVSNWVNTWAPQASNPNALSNVEGDLATVFWQNDPDFINYNFSTAKSYAGSLSLGSLVNYPSLAMELLSAFAQDEGFRNNANECG